MGRGGAEGLVAAIALPQHVAREALPLGEPRLLDPGRRVQSYVGDVPGGPVPVGAAHRVEAGEVRPGIGVQLGQLVRTVGRVTHPLGGAQHRRPGVEVDDADGGEPAAEPARVALQPAGVPPVRGHLERRDRRRHLREDDAVPVHDVVVLVQGVVVGGDAQEEARRGAQQTEDVAVDDVDEAPVPVVEGAALRPGEARLGEPGASGREQLVAGRHVVGAHRCLAAPAEGADEHEQDEGRSHAGSAPRVRRGHITEDARAVRKVARLSSRSVRTQRSRSTSRATRTIPTVVRPHATKST